MVFQTLALLIAKFGRSAFRLKGALLLPCPQFKRCAGFFFLTRCLIASSLLYTVGVPAQELTGTGEVPFQDAGVASTPISMAATALSAGIYLAVDGQAPPELDLGWQEPATSPVPITGYFIFRATSPSGPFSQLNSVAQTQTSYVDSSVQNGVTYYYHVESVATDGITSLPSSTVQVLAANPVAFGNQTLGSSTSLRTVVVTNSGSEVLTFGSIGLTGPSASQFATSNNCGTSLAARDSCTISLRFDPNAAGTHAAYISLSDNANGSPQSIPLAGTGVDFTQPPSSMQFNGSADLNNSALQLTNGGENEAGSVFYKTPVNVQSFTTDFTFELSNPSADGLTFTIQNVGPTALGGIPEEGWDMGVSARAWLSSLTSTIMSARVPTRRVFISMGLCRPCPRSISPAPASTCIAATP